MVLDFIKQHVDEPMVGVLAGNSVHCDQKFLLKEMPALMEYLHYRIVDVSSIKVLCKSWFKAEIANMPRKKLSHRALDDIKESIEELRYYRQNVFKN